MAPFSLRSYEDARDHALLLSAATRERRMPPWLPESSDFPFADAPRLSDREIAILARWAEQGAIMGDSVSSPMLPAGVDGWTLGEPDLILEMREPYLVPAGGGDVFRNFVLPVPLRETRYVRAVDLQPGDPRVVHHVVMAVDPTPTSRQEDERDTEPGFDGMFSRGGARTPAGFFVGWTPGRVPRANPDGLAWPLEPGSDVVIQMHLRPHASAGNVRARVALYFADSAASRTPVLLRLGSQTLDILAGDAAYAVADSFRLPVDVELLGLYPHAHYLGRQMDVRAAMPNGQLRQILRIDDWDFNWQDAYAFERPVALPAGTTLRLRYIYDNSAANPRNPNRPPRRVVYGPNSTDEMAELWIQVVPGSQSELAVLQRELSRKAVRDHVEGWQHLIRLDPRDALAHANLAAFYKSAGDADRAIDHYRQALESQPDFASAHYNLALLLETRRDTDGASRHYRSALRVQPDHARAHNNLGNILLAAGSRDEAATHFRRAVDLEPTQAEAHNNLGRVLWESGRTDEAIQHYRRAIELMPNAGAARFNLALALASQGRTADALSEFREGDRLQPGAVQAYVAMAWLLATHRDAVVRRPAEAIALANEAARLAGQPHPRILDALAAADAAAGRFDLAVSRAQEAIRLATSSNDHDLASRIRGRLELYRRKRPYIETR
ncbi:MAG: tetratricopeptide repeat protein [Longimicrobiales bacterium]